MNSRQLQYAILLSQMRNFSQVAEKLNISQPALSKQILNLERELGVRLFDRNSVPLTMTPAGEHFVQEAQDLIYREDQLLRSMDQYKSGAAGKLVIGISPFRSLYLIPGIVKKVRDKYPGIQISLHEANSDNLRKESAEGKYDFAVINLPVDESVLEITPIEPDTLVLAVPNELLSKLPPVTGGNLSEIDLRDCKELPFIVVGQTQEMRQLFDRLCALADFRPNIAMEVVGVTTAWAMAHAGIGATLLPLQFILDDKFDDSITLFTIKGNPFSRQPVVVTRRGQYLSEYARYAISLLTKSDQHLNAGEP